MQLLTPDFNISKFSSKNDGYLKENSSKNVFSPELSITIGDVSPRSDGYHRILLRSFSFVMADSKKLDGYIKKQTMGDFVDELKSIQARRELIHHDVMKRESIINDVILKSSDSGRAVLLPDTNELVYSTMEDLINLPAVADDTLISRLINADLFSTLSSKEINELLAKAIDSMSENYLDVFQQAVEKNAQFYKDFSDFMSSLTTFISADGDKTILDGSGFSKSLHDLMNKYLVPGISTTLFPVQTGSTVKGTSLEECEAWAREFGLSTTDCISKLANGTYIVHIDISPLNNINSSVKSENMSFNAAQWSAWQTGVDMQKDHIQNSMQTLTQKFANAHSTFDNLVKVLSSTISSLLECDKQFFV